MKTRNSRTFPALFLSSLAAGLVLCASFLPASQPPTIEELIATQLSHKIPTAFSADTDAAPAAGTVTTQDFIDSIHATTAPAATNADDWQNHTATTAASNDPRTLAAAPPPSPMVAPYGLALDEFGNLYVADGGANAIWKITNDTKIALLAGDPKKTAGSSDGKGTAARFNYPCGIVFKSDTLYVTEWNNHTIRAISPDGTVRTFAGSPGSAGHNEGTGTKALFNNPNGIVVDNNGQLYVADVGNSFIRRITPKGVTSWLSGQAYDRSFTFTGGGSLTRSGGMVSVTVFSNYSGTLSLDSGAVFTGNFYNRPVAFLLSGTDYSAILDGSIDFGGGYYFSGSSLLYITGSSIALVGDNITLLQSGTLPLAESGTSQPPAAEAPFISEARIADDTTPPSQIPVGAESFAPDAFTFYNLFGMTLSPDGNYLYACNTGPAICAIKIADGTITPLDTVIFGDGDTSLRPNYPRNIRFDNKGNLFIADTDNNRILKVDANDGTVACIAGPSDGYAYSNAGYKDGHGSVALFNGPTDIAIDSAGNIYVADRGNGVIRKIGAVSNNVTTLVLEEVSLGSKSNRTGNAVSGEGDGGGGALSAWYLLALAALAAARLRRR